MTSDLRRRSCAGLLALGVVTLLAGCGRDQPEPEPDPTNLVIELYSVNEHFQSQIDRFTLRCDPPGGTLPEPENLCAALADDPALLNPPQSTSMCAGGVSTPTLTVEGVAAGEPVELQFRCDGFPETRRRSLEFWFDAALSAQ